MSEHSANNIVIFRASIVKSKIVRIQAKTDQTTPAVCMSAGECVVSCKPHSSG